MRDLAVALKFVCVVFSRSAAPQKDRRYFAFLQWLVNMTLCPAEQKKGSSPCPVWLACRSHCPDGSGSEKGVMLVKTNQKSVWNMENYFRMWPSRSSLYNTARVLWAHLLCKFWSLWDMETIAGRSLSVCWCYTMSTAKDDSHDIDFSQYPDFLVLFSWKYPGLRFINLDRKYSQLSNLA